MTNITLAAIPMVDLAGAEDGGGVAGDGVSVTTIEGDGEDTGDGEISVEGAGAVDGVSAGDGVRAGDAAAGEGTASGDGLGMRGGEEVVRAPSLHI